MHEGITVTIAPPEYRRADGERRKSFWSKPQSPIQKVRSNRCNGIEESQKRFRPRLHRKNLNAPDCFILNREVPRLQNFPISRCFIEFYFFEHLLDNNAISTVKQYYPLVLQYSLWKWLFWSCRILPIILELLSFIQAKKIDFRGIGIEHGQREFSE